MGRRISRQRAAVERDARPGDGLHVGHVRIVIKVRVVLCLLLNDAEYAGRRLASFLAARHRGPQDPASSVIDGDSLVAQRNDSHDRFASDARLNKLDRAFRPGVSGGRMISRSASAAKPAAKATPASDRSSFMKAASCLLPCAGYPKLRGAVLLRSGGKKSTISGNNGALEHPYSRRWAGSGSPRLVTSKHAQLRTPIDQATWNQLGYVQVRVLLRRGISIKPMSPSDRQVHAKTVMAPFRELAKVM